MFIKKIAIYIEKKNNSIFAVPISMQKRILMELPKPKDDIQRAYNQYYCQMKLYKNMIMSVLFSVVSLPLLFFYYLKGESTIEKKDSVDAVFMSEGIPAHVIPESLKKEYSNWKVVAVHGEKLSKEDKKYFKTIFIRYPFSWHFLLKCLVKIRFYSYEIQTHHPKAIVVCGEYSFTSSMLTDYCFSCGVEHINVMHGEKLFFIRDSYFHFNRCYIWNKFYKELFCSLRAEAEQFIIEIPDALNFSVTIEEVKSIDYTYYLGAESGQTLENIIKYLIGITQQGKKVVIRPHPRYSDIDRLEHICGAIEIEDIKSVEIERSILRTYHAIAGYSTVLNQAYHNGTSIVIDNLSNPMSYRKLIELEYTMLKVEHLLLSDVL